MPQPNELIARMSRDPRTNAFHSENLSKLFPEFLWKILHESEQQLLKDLKCKVKEQDSTLAKGQRAVNLPDDHLILKSVRYIRSGDDALFEGWPIKIVDESDQV